MLRHKKSVKLRLLLVSRLKAFALPNQPNEQCRSPRRYIVPPSIQVNKSLFTYFIIILNKLKQMKISKKHQISFT